MKREVVVYVQPGTLRWSDAESIATTLSELAMRWGGKCVAKWCPAVMEIRLQHVRSRQVALATRAVAAHLREPGTSVTILQRDEAVSPMPDLRDGVPWGTVLRAKLTRHLIYGLPVGAYVTVVRRKTGQRLFSEQLGESRSDSWARALDSHAAYRVCRIAWSWEQFQEHRSI